MEGLYGSRLQFCCCKMTVGRICSLSVVAILGALTQTLGGWENHCQSQHGRFNSRGLRWAKRGGESGGLISILALTCLPWCTWTSMSKVAGTDLTLHAAEAYSQAKEQCPLTRRRLPGPESSLQNAAYVPLAQMHWCRES